MIGCKKYLYLFLLSLFWLYLIVVRGFCALFTEDIRLFLGLDIYKFSQLTIVFTIGYTCLQIPFGILIDRIGVRKVLLCSFGLCLVGNEMFSLSNSYECSLLGRFLSGVGATPIYISIVIFVANSFAEKNKSLAIGISTIIAFCSSIIFNPLLKYIGVKFGNWHNAINAMNLFGLLILILGVFILKIKTYKRANEVGESFGKTFFRVAVNPLVYVYGACIVSTNTLCLVLNNLWCTNILTSKFNFSPISAVASSQFIFVGFIIGAVILPILFRGKRSLIGVRISLIGIGLILFFIICVPQNFDKRFLQIMLLIFGIFGETDVLLFAMMAKETTNRNTGITLAWLNFIAMICEPLLHWIISITLDTSWSGKLNEYGLRIYDANMYENALKYICFIVFVCLFLTFLVREKVKD